MSSLKEAFRNVLVVVVAVVLSAVAIVFAPIPLALLKRRRGFLTAVLISVATMAGLWFSGAHLVALAFAVSALTAIVFTECENQGLSYSSSGVVTTLVVSGLSVLVVGYLMRFHGFNPIEFSLQQIQFALKQVNLPAEVKIDPHTVLIQLPSALITALIFSIWLCTISVPKVEAFLNWQPLAQEKFFTTKQLLSWKLPDVFVWVAFAGIAGTFLKIHPAWIKTVATNLFNVAVVLYFFQGLAIVVSFFEAKKVTGFWRAVAYLFIFSQLFLMVSAVGFADLWMEFRNKLNPKRKASLSKRRSL